MGQDMSHEQQEQHDHVPLTQAELSQLVWVESQPDPECRGKHIPGHYEPRLEVGTSYTESADVSSGQTWSAPTTQPTPPPAPKVQHVPQQGTPPVAEATVTPKKPIQVLEKRVFAKTVPKPGDKMKATFASLNLQDILGAMLEQGLSTTDRFWILVITVNAHMAERGDPNFNATRVATSFCRRHVVVIPKPAEPIADCKKVYDIVMTTLDGKIDPLCTELTSLYQVQSAQNDQLNQVRLNGQSQLDIQHLLYGLVVTDQKKSTTSGECKTSSGKLNITIHNL